MKAFGFHLMHQRRSQTDGKEMFCALQQELEGTGWKGKWVWNVGNIRNTSKGREFKLENVICPQNIARASL